MKLRGYQRKGLRFLVQKRKAALFWEMRLGKTVTAMKAVRALGGFPCLVVSPYSAFLSWEDEIGYDRIAHLIGTAKQRYDILRTSKKKWFLINREGFQVVPQIAAFPWSAIIFDESIALKSPKALISKFYVDKFGHVPIKFILTGMPAPENNLEYIQQLRFIDSINLDYWKFRHIHCMPVGFKYYVKTSGKIYLTDHLSKCADFLKTADVDLEVKKIRSTRKVELSKKAMNQYELIINKLKIDDNKETIFKMVAFSWARQLFGGFVNGKPLYNEKIKELKYLLGNELHGQGVLVFAFFKNEIYFLREALRKFKVQVIDGSTKQLTRKKIITDFQNGKIKIIICQPEVVKHGVNFSKADTVIFFSTPLGLESRLQCEARACMDRKGVLIIDLVCANTIEEDIIKSLQRKETRAQMYERIVKKIQNESISN